MNIPHFIYSPVNGYCFHFLAMRNTAAMNIHIQLFVWTYIFTSLRYIPRMELNGHRVGILLVL